MAKNQYNTKGTAHPLNAIFSTSMLWKVGNCDSFYTLWQNSVYISYNIKIECKCSLSN